jgi:hypothetical protein
VAAQTYLYTTRPSRGDPREHMHRAALQGLRMVGNKLIAKEEEAHRNKGTHKSRSPRHHGSPQHRSATDDLGHHRQSDTEARIMEEPEDPGPPPKHMTTRTTKKRWGPRALLTGFALRHYPRVSNYHMINKNTMDLRNPNHGSRITYKQ